MMSPAQQREHDLGRRSCALQRRAANGRGLQSPSASSVLVATPKRIVLIFLQCPLTQVGNRRFPMRSTAP